MLNSSIINTPVMLCCITLFLIYWVFFSKRRAKTLPPGPRPIPIVGNLLELVFGGDPCDVLSNLSNKYGPIFSMDYASFPAVVLQSHELIRKCFNQNVFAGRPKFQVFLERDGGMRGIAFSERNTSIEQRRFAIRNLRDFGFGKKTMEIMIQEDATKLIDKLEKSAGKPISMQDTFSFAVVGSVWKIITGEEVDESDPEIKRAFSLIKKSSENGGFTGVVFFFPKFSKTFPNFTGYTKFLNNQLAVRSFIESIVNKFKMTYEDGVERHLIDTYYKEINNTTDPNSSFYGQEGDKQMVTSVLDLFQGAVETTSTALTWVFLILALYPEFQDKLYKEIDEVITRDNVSLEDRDRMPFTECFLMEVLRYASVIPLGVFHNTIDDTIVNGYNIPRETVVIPNIKFALNDPYVWGDPENIRPERFMLNDGTVNRQHPAWIPFSVGKRVCPGEKLAKDELFIFTTSICKNFRIEVDTSRPKPTLEAPSGVTRSPMEHHLVLQKRVDRTSVDKST